MDIQTLQADIDALRGSFTKFAADVSGKFTTLNATIDDLKAQIAAIPAAVDLTAVDQAVNDMKGVIDAADAALNPPA